MAFVMEIKFSNNYRLLRRIYYFEYKGVRFKLVQDDPRKWADHLLTIIPGYNDIAARNRAYVTGSEFLSALAWDSATTVAIGGLSGHGWRDQWPLRKAWPTLFDFPRISMRGYTLGRDLTRIPDIQTEEQRTALALFREARASNNYYLSFLFFWQVLDVGGGKPKAFIDTTLRKHRHHLKLGHDAFERLPLEGRMLGEYLEDDCRHAIAHIRRRPGRKQIDLDNPDERTRLAISTHVMEAFAEAYIRHSLGLSKELWLVKPKSGGFPRFMDEKTLSKGNFRLAYYPPKPLKLPKPKPLKRPLSARARRRGRYY